MNNKITLENTLVSFTPSFLGNGWETSLLPKIERGCHHAEYRITFDWLKKMFVKMQIVGHHASRQAGRLEVKQWTTAIARLFL